MSKAKIPPQAPVQTAPQPQSNIGMSDGPTKVKIEGSVWNRMNPLFYKVFNSLW